MQNLFTTRPLEPKENLKVIICIDFKGDYSIIDLLNIPGPIIDFLREEYPQEIFDWNELFDPKQMRPGTFFEIEFFIRCEQISYEYPNDMDCIATVRRVGQVVYDNLNNRWLPYGLDKRFNSCTSELDTDIAEEHY